MHRRRGNIDASDRQLSLESESSGWRMQQLQKSEVGEDMESNRRTRDINPNLENFAENINVNVLKDGVEKNVRVYAKEQCSIPAGMGKYIPVQINREIQGDVLV